MTARRTTRRASLAALLLLLPLLAASAGLARAENNRRVRLSQLSDKQRFALPAKIRLKAVREVGLKTMAFRRSFLRRHNAHYSNAIPLERLPHVVRNQKQSGRCWIFGSELVLRSKSLQQNGRPADKLSVSFVNHHALRMQAVAMLGYIAEELRHGRKPDPDYASDSLGEGGWYAYANKIIKKHGIVPESVMPSTFDANASGVLLRSMTELIADAQRDMSKVQGSSVLAVSARHQIVAQYQKKIVWLLDTTLGKPPTDLAVRDARGRQQRLTPQRFLREHLGVQDRDLEYVRLNHDPRISKWLTARWKSKGGALVHQASYVPLSVLEAAVRRTIDGGEAVALSTNVSGDNRHRVDGDLLPKKAQGILSVSAFNYAPFIPEAKLSQKTRLRGSVSPTNHLMAITAYDRAARGNVARKFKIDNSWGADIGDKGHLHMYGDYFREYVTSVVVPRWAVPTEVMARIEAGRLADHTTPRASLAREQRWGRKQKRQLVLDLLSGELTEHEAVKAYGVSKRRMREWKRNALSAAAKALAESGVEPQ